MGYNTHVEGQFMITPPLAWPEFKDSEFAPHNIKDSYDPDVVLVVAEDNVDTPDGPLLKRTATALAMREIDEYRAYNLLDQVQKAVDSFPGRAWSGRLDCEGEESADLWRVVIRDGRAVKVEPRIVWPDDEAAPTVDRWALAEVLASSLDDIRRAATGLDLDVEHDRRFIATALTGAAANYIES